MPSASTVSRVFFDTNVLAYTDDKHRNEKRRRAIELVRLHRSRDTGAVSTQVLQEYFTCVTSKYKIDSQVARRKIETFARFHVVRPDVADVIAAIDLHRIHHISFWDTLILRMARQAGCRTLLSEDMSHGQEIDGVRIVNPFLDI